MPSFLFFFLTCLCCIGFIILHHYIALQCITLCCFWLHWITNCWLWEVPQPKSTERCAFTVICQRKVNQKPSVQPSANQTTKQLKILPDWIHFSESPPILIDIIQLEVGQKLESDHAWLSFVTEQQSSSSSSSRRGQIHLFLIPSLTAPILWGMLAYMQY